MSAQIAQRFAAIDHRSNGSYRVPLVYNAASYPNPNPHLLLLPQSLLPSPASPTPSLDPPPLLPLSPVDPPHACLPQTPRPRAVPFHSRAARLRESRLAALRESPKSPRGGEQSGTPTPPQHSVQIQASRRPLSLATAAATDLPSSRAPSPPIRGFPPAFCLRFHCLVRNPGLVLSVDFSSSPNPSFFVPETILDS
jgi:hypothetical protein